MSKTEITRLCHLVCVAAAGFAFLPVNAQTVVSPTPAVKTERATIMKMTEKAEDVALEKLEKELRDLKGEKPPEAPMPGVDGLGAQIQPPVPVRVAPTPPGVSAVYGTGGVLRARLDSGQEVKTGAHSGEWKVVSVEASGVNFERCETVRKKRKSKAQSECESRFVAPSFND